MQTTTNLKTSSFTGADGVRIFYRNWRVEGKPKALVLIVHGLNSHSAYYDQFALQLNEHQYEAYALDLRGRGRSNGERYYIADYHDVSKDIDQFYNIAVAAHRNVPVFLYGHSAGGVFASVFAADNQSKLRGLICASFAFRIPAPAFAVAFIKLLSYIIPHAKLVKLKNEDFSRDQAVTDRLNNDPLMENEVQPNKTMQQLFAASKYLEAQIPQIKLPLLILHGTADKATKPEGSQYFMEHAASADKQLKLYEGHYHDLLNDKYNGIVVRDIINWLDERA
ncbi:alpha/beta hydrolase [Mucilaginibacter pedocola]|uniref:Lipase n=1 Tax=Mucilaginibacter pedocola TaxID=1792845 RepID=A0A1S9P753_9SPHI|nr:alpha/beta hydrolase [Mucilaginibacter pedocola]OOQ56781.1 lipase [Mucilaginibacter pedocola]